MATGQRRTCKTPLAAEGRWPTRFRIFATCDIGEPAEYLLREKCVRGLIDVLEGSYGGDISKMPHVVNKEAFIA
ncbi:MAG: hypothetical protein ACM3SW_04080 [Actinomycetota bacterium]